MGNSSEGVRAKKHLGQHFLNDLSIAQKIADALLDLYPDMAAIEIGPGTGVLTQFLVPKLKENFYAMDVDRDSIALLHKKYPDEKNRIQLQDFLKADLSDFKASFNLIGNFPYNISSQILFKALEHRDQIPCIVGMFQKEVAERIAEKPGSKTYGIMSVLIQAFYEVSYLFTVHEHVFTPPPKVKSAVIRLVRNERKNMACDEKLFIQVVKTAFNQRRKTLRNSLKTFFPEKSDSESVLYNKRPEQLSVEDFIHITQYITSIQTK